jgi:uncharacterized protein YecT (DUF1311 family)
MRWSHCALATIAIAAPTLAAAPAIEARYSKTYDRCVNGTGDFATQGTGYGNLGCTFSEVRHQNSILNATYQRVMKRLSSQRKQALRSSERQWIVERDRKCGTIEAAIEINDPTVERPDAWCILEETIKRIIWLETYS